MSAARRIDVDRLRLSEHERLIRAAVAEGYERSRFHKRLAAILVGHSCDKRKCRCEPPDLDGDELDGLDIDWCRWRETYERICDVFPRIPDAFRIDKEHERIVLVEVEITSALTAEKVSDMTDLEFELDAYGAWTIDVRRVGRGGASTTTAANRLLEDLRGG